MENEKFNFDYLGHILKVERFEIGCQAFFRINFPDKEPQLVILRANHGNGHKFWTSMPEGGQALAEVIGPLIENYYRSQK